MASVGKGLESPRIHLARVLAIHSPGSFTELVLRAEELKAAPAAPLGSCMTWESDPSFLYLDFPVCKMEDHRLMGEFKEVACLESLAGKVCSCLPLAKGLAINKHNK